MLPFDMSVYPTSNTNHPNLSFCTSCRPPAINNNESTVRYNGLATSRILHTNIIAMNQPKTNLEYYDI